MLVCIYTRHKYINKLYTLHREEYIGEMFCYPLLLMWPSSSSSSSECSTQRQVLHCKRRNLGCSSGQVFHRKLRNQGCSFTRDWIGAVASCCFLHTTLWTNLKRSENIPGASTWRWREWIWITGPSGLHQNSPQGLNISSIRVFDQSDIWKSQITLCSLVGPGLIPGQVSFSGWRF